MRRIQAIDVERETREELRRRGVRIDVQDDDTVVLLSVPTDLRFFNKPRTNLLIKRPGPGMPYLVGVDADLEYTGTDAPLARAFEAAQRRRGWRLLLLAASAGAGLGSALDGALEAVGFGGRTPALAPRIAADAPNAPGALAGPTASDDAGAHDPLECLAVNVSRRARRGTGEPTVGREEQVERVLAALLGWRPTMPLVVGAPGIGKTNLLSALAHRLIDARPETELFAVDLGRLFAGTVLAAERETLLASLLERARARPECILALERFELVLLEVPHGLFQIAEALEAGTRLTGTTAPRLGRAFESSPLAGRLTVVPLQEPGPEQTLRILAAARPAIESHHGVNVPEEMLEAVVAEAPALPGHLPGKAVSLLDAAAARARLAGAEEVELAHVYLAAEHASW